MTRKRKGPTHRRPAKDSASTPVDAVLKSLREQVSFQSRVSADDLEKARPGAEVRAVVSPDSDVERLRSHAEEWAANLADHAGESEPPSGAPCPEVKTPESRPAKKRGPTADMDLHRAIARIVTPYGSNWKNESNLEKIAEQLDKNPLTPPPKQWAERKPPARSWSRAVRHYPEVVVKRISYSLNMASRNPQ
jgi:hypothetical protein